MTEVVSSIKEAASVISENACTVPEAESRSAEISASEADKFSARDASPFSAETSATKRNASRAVLEIVSVKVSLIS